MCCVCRGCTSIVVGLFDVSDEDLEPKAKPESGGLSEGNKPPHDSMAKPGMVGSSIQRLISFCRLLQRENIPKPIHNWEAKMISG